MSIDLRKFTLCGTAYSFGTALETGNEVYTKVARFYYSGTSNCQSIFKVDFNCYVSHSDTVGDYKIIRVDTGDTIAEITGVDSLLDENTVTTETITNLPTAKTLFELQIKRTGGAANRRAYCESINII